jgi:hypothetical protein
MPCRRTIALMADDALGRLLAEQVAYYRACAPEYLDGALDLPGGRELTPRWIVSRRPVTCWNLRAGRVRGRVGCCGTPRA